jgi:hypothetical protein
MRDDAADYHPWRFYNAPFRPIFRYYVLLPALDPIGGDAALRVTKSHLAGARFSVKLSFKRIE